MTPIPDLNRLRAGTFWWIIVGLISVIVCRSIVMRVVTVCINGDMLSVNLTPDNEAEDSANGCTYDGCFSISADCLTDKGTTAATDDEAAQPAIAGL